jgi:ABC-2 type transport system ATP-binding protein
MDEADRLSNRIAIMDYGKIIALDTPAKLKDTLEGDVITIKADNLVALSSLIAEKMGLTKARIIDGALEITARQGKSLLPRIVETATENKIFIESILMREPNLEDVFLHYTGRIIRGEGGGRELHGFSAIQRRKIK